MRINPHHARDAPLTVHREGGLPRRVRSVPAARTDPRPDGTRPAPKTSAAEASRAEPRLRTGLAPCSHPARGRPEPHHSPAVPQPLGARGLRAQPPAPPPTLIRRPLQCLRAPGLLSLRKKVTPGPAQGERESDAPRAASGESGFRSSPARVLSRTPGCGSSRAELGDRGWWARVPGPQPPRSAPTLTEKPAQKGQEWDGDSEPELSPLLQPLLVPSQNSPTSQSLASPLPGPFPECQQQFPGRPGDSSLSRPKGNPMPWCQQRVSLGVWGMGLRLCRAKLPEGVEGF